MPFGKLWSRRRPRLTPADQHVREVTRLETEPASVANKSQSVEKPPSHDEDIKQSAIINQASSAVNNQGSVRISGDQVNYFVNLRHPKAERLSVSTSNVSIPSQKSLTQSEREYLQDLAPVPLFGTRPAENAPGTLVWLQNDDKYLEWRTSQSSRILLVTGYAGSGKSVIAAYMSQSLAASSASETVICQYYFDSKGADDGECLLLRSLIFQLVSERPKLMKILQKLMVQGRNQTTTDVQSLWEIFRKLMKDKRVKNLYIIIDAVDQCDEKVQRLIARHFQRLIDTEPHVNLKILITSRPTVPAVQALEPKSSLAEMNMDLKGKELERDLGVYIEDFVSTLILEGRCSEDNKLFLVNALQSKAENTYLWLSLAMIKFTGRRRFRKKDIVDIVSKLPEGIAEMYESFLDDIPIDDRPRAGAALSFVHSSARPLRISELNALVSIHEGEVEAKTIDHEDRILTNRSDVESLLRGLVKIKDDCVDVFHQTLKEYLQSARNSDLVSIFLGPGATRDESLIAKSCMQYLLLDDFRIDLFAGNRSSSDSSAETTSSWNFKPEDESPVDVFAGMFQEAADISEAQAKSLAQRFSLFDYAAQRWAVHHYQCHEENQAENWHLANRLYSPQGPRNWLKYLTALSPGQYPSDPDALTLACFFGHSHSARELALLPSSGRAEALYWASKMGHAKCIEILLDSTNTWENGAQHNGHSPLSIAAAQGWYACVEILLASHIFDVNQPPALLYAAGASNVNLVSALLEDENIQPNIQDQDGTSALFWAVDANSVDTVKRLLDDQRIDPLMMDHKKRTALSLACEMGVADIVELLVPHSGVDTEDSKGLTPLMYAARGAHLKVIKCLIKHKASTTKCDNDGRNPTSWAAQCVDSAVLGYLLKKNPEEANRPDKNRWTPFDWTLEPPGRYENAALLLKYVRKDLDDQSGLAMYALATSWSPQIAKLLVTEKIFNLNTKAAAKDGRTALSFAAASGHLELVKQLLSMGDIDVNSRDVQGRGPSFYAKEAGHTEICALLGEPSNEN